MRHFATILLATALAGSMSAQQEHTPSQAGAGAVPMNISSSLPIERIGNDDLI